MSVKSGTSRTRKFVFTPHSSRWGQQSLSAQTAHFSLFCVPFVYVILIIKPHLCLSFVGLFIAKQFEVCHPAGSVKSNSVLALTEINGENYSGFQ